ncbi:MAG: zf-TFIIB domain-containing protein, partial [Rhodobacteraceae bacterium]|nr:zf-TFIIB domain-containing protein [Paracoccaceae bacterium]
GVWLDRGELDKIVERSAVTMAPVQADPPPVQPTRAAHHGARPHDEDDGHSHGGYRKKRRESFLGDLFDF